MKMCGALTSADFIHAPLKVGEVVSETRSVDELSEAHRLQQALCCNSTTTKPTVVTVSTCGRETNRR